jgi:3-hydroxybutyryl-CoA dehydrogenase
MIDKVVIIGSGLMGTGIAQVTGQAGYQVVIVDISADALNRSKETINKQLTKLVEKTKLTSEEAESIRGKIVYTTEFKNAVAEADYLIEAVPEDLELKRKILFEADSILKPDAIIASNTSQLSITTLAQATSRGDRVIGTHWFYPPSIMRLVEIIVGKETSKATLEATVDFCRKVGKETVVCRDAYGFITSRAISAFVAECLRIYEEDVASIEDIDRAVMLGFNHPVGPFRLMDMSGIDTVLHSLEDLSKVYGERFTPTRTMVQHVKNGALGQKTGKGFYDYSSH